MAATPDGDALLAVQSRNGKLFRIDPDTGDTDEIEIAGGSLVNGDGILLRGRTLYVVRNFDNVITQVRLDADFEEGRIVRELRDEDFDVDAPARPRTPGHRPRRDRRRPLPLPQPSRGACRPCGGLPGRDPAPRVRRPSPPRFWHPLGHPRGPGVAPVVLWRESQ